MNKNITSIFSKEEILNMFLTFYDTNWWIIKTRTLQLLIEDEELLIRINQDKVLKKFEKDKLKRSYEYDLYMTSYHSSEALFGLLFAFLFQKYLPLMRRKNKETQPKMGFRYFHSDIV